MTGKSVDLHEYEAEAVASLVKLYLRELPENILTVALAPKFNELSGKKNSIQSNSVYNSKFFYMHNVHIHKEKFVLFLHFFLFECMKVSIHVITYKIVAQKQ